MLISHTLARLVLVYYWASTNAPIDFHPQPSPGSPKTDFVADILWIELGGRNIAKNKYSLRRIVAQVSIHFYVTFLLSAVLSVLTTLPGGADEWPSGGG